MEKTLNFKKDGKVLRGILHLPEHISGRVPALVMCHGFMGNKIGMHRLFVKAARNFANAGYAIYRFDFSGCGDSDGEHEDITLDQQILEVQAAIKALSMQPGIDTSRIFLLGLSLGGCVAALALPLIHDLKGVVLWAPVARPEYDLKNLIGETTFASVLANQVSDFEGFALGNPLLESLKRHDPLSTLAKFLGPVLIIHGTGDKEISYNNANDFAEKRKQEGLLLQTEVRFIRNADHTFSSLAWEKELFAKTIRWLNAKNTNFELQSCSLSI